jgi:hypothetical protein
LRTLTDHIVSGDQAVQLSISVTDEPGAGGANHAYHVDWHTDIAHDPTTVAVNSLDIHFQEGPIKEFGVNGITQEALLAIVIDRLRSFQAGPFACEDNATALDHCQKALETLQKRTLARIARGVEGTNQK